MVEPLEETRSELTFATEPLLSSLSQSIPSASRSPLVDLDEVEVCPLAVTLLTSNELFAADSEGYSAALQGSCLSAYVGASYSFEHLTE